MSSWRLWRAKKEEKKSEKNILERIKRFEGIEMIKNEQRWRQKRARNKLEKKLPPGKRILQPGAEVKLGRKDYEKPITKDLRRRKKFEKSTWKCS